MALATDPATTAPPVAGSASKPAWRASWAPVACGCGLAVAAAYVVVDDPHDGTLLACPVHTMTGLWCPGCGMTRATHHLLRGDVGRALGYNLFAPLILALIAGSWWSWLRARRGRRAVFDTDDRRVTWSLLALGALFIAFGVVRNLPGFDALAP